MKQSFILSTAMRNLKRRYFFKQSIKKIYKNLIKEYSVLNFALQTFYQTFGTKEKNSQINQN